MGEQLFQYKKFYEDGKTVWKRVPYDGGNADAVFPNTPEDQRNGKVMFSGSAKVQELMQKQLTADVTRTLQNDLAKAGYKEIKIQKKWAPSGGTKMLVTMYWSGPITLELLELEFTIDEFNAWFVSDKTKVGPNPEKWSSSPAMSPHNPLARYLLERDKLKLVEEELPTEGGYNRKLDIE